MLLPQEKQSIDEALAENPGLEGPRWTAVCGNEAYQIRLLHEKLQMHYWNWREQRDRDKWSHLPWQWFFGAHHSWKRILKLLSDSFTPDYFLVEHVRNAEIFNYAKTLWPDVFCVCNSHNVESSLLRQVLAVGGGKEKTVRAIEKYERRVLNRVDLLWACSVDDLQEYRGLGVRPKNTGVVPNGVDTARLAFVQCSAEQRRSILFAGNLAYAPNIEGVLWFRREVWPSLKRNFPDLQWQLVGSWADPAVLAIAERDIRVAVDVPSMEPYLASATVAICPLFSGSGTRLKILDAFSAGVPMVSTSKGAEGLDIEQGVHLLIADSAEGFATAVAGLLDDPARRESLRRHARDLAEKNYDWRVISAKAAEQLLSLG